MKIPAGTAVYKGTVGYQGGMETNQIFLGSIIF